MHIGDQGHLRELGGRLASAEDEDRHAVVMVAAPAAGRLEGAPPGDGRSGGHELVHDRAVDAARPADGLQVDVAAGHQPVVEPKPTVTEAVFRPLVRPSDEPIERHGHVQNGYGQGASLPAFDTCPYRSGTLGETSSVSSARRRGRAARPNEPPFLPRTPCVSDYAAGGSASAAGRSENACSASTG